jgi:basic membrane lipoprotein Med (substrate-binding protein (PBP1-ABC) superfamily)
MKKLLIAILAVIACLAIGAVGASGADSTKTKVTIHFNGGSGDYGKFYGRVKSKKAACERHRKVVVKRKQPGKDAKYGSTFSDNDGRWEISATSPVTPGKYYAVAKKKVLNNGHVCKKGRSGTITVP